MAKIYIYSTLTSDQVYANYGASANGVPVLTSKIAIQGGANLMRKNLVTPHGVVTTVSAEDLAELRKNEVFKLHLENGFLKISEAKADADDVAADMETRDQSAPIVEQDGLVPVPVGSEEDEKPKGRRGRGQG